MRRDMIVFSMSLIILRLNLLILVKLLTLKNFRNCVKKRMGSSEFFFFLMWFVMNKAYFIILLLKVHRQEKECVNRFFEPSSSKYLYCINNTGILFISLV